MDDITLQLGEFCFITTTASRGKSSLLLLFWSVRELTWHHLANRNQATSSVLLSLRTTLPLILSHAFQAYIVFCLFSLLSLTQKCKMFPIGHSPWFGTDWGDRPGSFFESASDSSKLAHKLGGKYSQPDANRRAKHPGLPRHGLHFFALTLLAVRGAQSSTM